MRKKQTIEAILHFPASENAIHKIEEHLRIFYLSQVEKQLNQYELTRQQKVQVVDQLRAIYSEK